MGRKDLEVRFLGAARGIDMFPQKWQRFCVGRDIRCAEDQGRASNDTVNGKAR